MVTKQYCDLCNSEVKSISEFYLINIKKNGINQFGNDLKQTEVCEKCFIKIRDFINNMRIK